MTGCGTYIEHIQGVPDSCCCFFRAFPCSFYTEPFIYSLDGMPDPGRLFFSFSPGQRTKINICSGCEGGCEKFSGCWFFSDGICAFVYPGAGTFDNVAWIDINGFSREKKGGGTACGHEKCPGLFELDPGKKAGAAPPFPGCQPIPTGTKKWIVPC